MQKRQLLLIGGFALSAALMYAQTLPSTVPLASRERIRPRPWSVKGEARLFNLRAAKYQAKVTEEQVRTCPDWTSTAALPLSLEKVEQIARGELRKLVSDDSTWEVTEFSLKRLHGDTQPKWFYVVTLRPFVGTNNAASDSFSLPINSLGEPGQIKLGQTP